MEIIIPQAGAAGQSDSIYVLSWYSFSPEIDANRTNILIETKQLNVIETY